MNDYRVTVKVRNNRILKAIEAVGGTPGGKWCAANGLCYVRLNSLINMTISPISQKSGGLIPAAARLCEVVNCLPEDLWSNEQLYPLESNFTEIEMSHESMLEMLSESRDSSYLQDFESVERQQQTDALNDALGSLTAREAEVIRQRFFEDLTLGAIGKRLGVTTERIRQIEAKGLRKLRRPERVASFAPAVMNEELLPRHIKKKFVECQP